MRKTPPILAFPRLMDLEKRLSRSSELSVDKIKQLEKKLLVSIQELSTSLEKDETKSTKQPPMLKEFPEETPNNGKNAKKPEIPEEKREISQEKGANPDPPPTKILVKEETSASKVEISEQNEPKDRKSGIFNSFDLKKPQKSSVVKRKLEDSTKQACLDEYFLEKPGNSNENSINLLQKPRFAKTKEKEPLKSPISKEFPVSPAQKPKETEDYEREIKSLMEKLSEKERESKENERVLSRLNTEKVKYKEIHERFIEDFMSYKNQVQKLLSNYLLECERYKKNEIKAHLSSQRHRLGEFISQRNGARFEDIWVDGYELRNLKENLNKICSDKEELKNRKKGLKKNSFALGPDALQLEKTTISQRIKLLSNEEENIKTKIENLNAEIFEFVTEYKKQYEEDHSKYGKPNQNDGKPSWPIIGERYQLLSLIGKGGFSEVYKAFDLEDFHLVACKINEINPIWTENLKQNYIKHLTREIEIHKNLSHINIVKLSDIVEIDSNSFCTVLEFCEGPDLGFHLKKHKTLPEKEARLILQQIVNGVKYLNEYSPKIIHYDLKPQNILFHKGLIKLSDFGLCKIIDGDSTKVELTSQGLGTYWYLPPECFESPQNLPNSEEISNVMISQKVDVWSIGVIFYEMLYGAKPFGNSMSQERLLQEKVILRANTVNFPNSSNVSSEAKEFISKCLKYDQRDRADIATVAGCSYLAKK